MKKTIEPVPKLRPLKLPDHQVRTLANGLTVHLVPRGPLPLVAVRLVIRAGSAFDPLDRLGVGDFAARLFRRGAAGQSADQISDTVDFVGASMGGFANEENVIMSLSTPSKHFDSMFELMAKVLLEPDFPENELELASEMDPLRQRAEVALGAAPLFSLGSKTSAPTNVSVICDRVAGAVADAALVMVMAYWTAAPGMFFGLRLPFDGSQISADVLKTLMTAELMR